MRVCITRPNARLRAGDPLDGKAALAVDRDGALHLMYIRTYGMYAYVYACMHACMHAVDREGAAHRIERRIGKASDDQDLKHAYG